MDTNKTLTTDNTDVADKKLNPGNPGNPGNPRFNPNPPLPVSIRGFSTAWLRLKAALRKQYACAAGGLPVLAFALLLAGCISRSKAHARAQQAYMAGQNAAFQQQKEQSQLVDTNGVTVLGPVQNPHVPWVAGLTLAQAIATANYLDSNMPKEIIITRQGESAKLAPNWLLTGADVPLEKGDVIEVKP